MIKNEFRIVEKKSKKKEGILTYYVPEYRTSKNGEIGIWRSAHRHVGDRYALFITDYQCSSKEEAMQKIEECKKALEISQYENVVYEEN